ncbi:NADP-dependent oxidoreductase [Psychrobacter sp. DM8]|uniref:NADP-dependent oxidoreductase n=1 Tax=Psychrobacter sp. DM8 TaxID=3440636 RepID=UPI003F4F4A2B
MSTHAIPKDQHAVLISKFGTPEVMRYEGGVQVPDIGDNQVLIKVAYAGINPVDYKTRQGKGWGADNIQKQYFDKGWSAILGFDVAGIVVKSSSDDFAIGDKVAALSFNGQCYAEYVAVEAGLLAKVPKTVSLEQAGAVPCVGQTALQFIDFADIKAGEHVVMNAPAGGVGQLVVQLLMDKVATMGIKVTVICSPDKYDKISGLIDRNQLAGWIDYTKDDNFPNLQADVLLDLVGNEAGVRALSVLKPRARVFVLPTIWVDKLKEAGSDKNLSVEGYAVKPNGQDMTRVLKCLADSKLTLQIQQVYPLAQVVAAHTDLQKGDAFGKLVLAV